MVNLQQLLSKTYLGSYYRFTQYTDMLSGLACLVSAVLAGSVFTLLSITIKEGWRMTACWSQAKLLWSLEKMSQAFMWPFSSIQSSWRRGSWSLLHTRQPILQIWYFPRKPAGDMKWAKHWTQRHIGIKYQLEWWKGCKASVTDNYSRFVILQAQ